MATHTDTATPAAQARRAGVFATPWRQPWVSGRCGAALLALAGALLPHAAWAAFTCDGSFHFTAANATSGSRTAILVTPSALSRVSQGSNFPTGFPYGYNPAVNLMNGPRSATAIGVYDVGPTNYSNGAGTSPTAWGTNVATIDAAGVMYTIDDTGAILYAVTNYYPNAASAVVTTKNLTYSGGATAGMFAVGTLDQIAWYNNTLWGINRSHQLLSINPSTGVASLVTTVTVNGTVQGTNNPTRWALAYSASNGFFAQRGFSASATPVTPLNYIYTDGPAPGTVSPIWAYTTGQNSVNGAHCASAALGGFPNDLQVTMTTTATNYQPGTTVTYTIKATNPANTTTGIIGSLNNPLPAGITTAAWSCAGANAANGLLCTTSGTGAIADNYLALPWVSSGGSSSLTYTMTLTIPTTYTAGSLTNTATGDLTFRAVNTDTNTANNTVSITLPQLQPNIAITKLQSSSNYTPGGTGTYTLTATNTGGAAYGVMLTDVLPKGTILTGAPTCSATTTVGTAALGCTGSISASTPYTSDGVTNALTGLSLSLPNGQTTPQTITVTLPVQFAPAAATY